VPVGDPGDQGAQLDALGDGGRVRQGRVGLEHVALWRPDHPIWKKWSMTHSEASPHWSASRATARQVAPVERGRPAT
jgi:hypothetical protein